MKEILIVLNAWKLQKYIINIFHEDFGSYESKSLIHTVRV